MRSKYSFNPRLRDGRTFLLPQRGHVCIKVECEWGSIVTEYFNPPYYPKGLILMDNHELDSFLPDNSSPPRLRTRRPRRLETANRGQVRIECLSVSYLMVALDVHRDRGPLSAEVQEREARPAAAAAGPVLGGVGWGLS